MSEFPALLPTLFPGLTLVSRPIFENIFAKYRNKFCILTLVFFRGFEREIFYGNTKFTTQKKLLCVQTDTEKANNDFPSPFLPRQAKIEGRPPPKFLGKIYFCGPILDVLPNFRPTGNSASAIPLLFCRARGCRTTPSRWRRWRTPWQLSQRSSYKYILKV